jgi:glycosyltransferase involved in cell wall biosynthesis
LLSTTPRYEIYETVPVYRVGLALPGFLGSMSYLISGLFWLIRNKKSYTVIHAHLASSTAVLAAIASLLTGKPALVKFACSREGGDIATSSATWYGRLKLRFLKHYIKAFVCPSDEIKNEMINYGFKGSKITVIPNGIDTNEFKPPSAQERLEARKKLSINSNTFVAIFAGRLEPAKGVEYLIDAWKTNNTPDATLLLIGKGYLEGELRQRAAGDKSIRFEGWTADIKVYFAAADVFVLPSLAEGMPNALIEAMACGLPCIGSDIGGTTELIIADKTGMLASPSDVKTLASAIERLQADTYLRARLGLSARQFIEKGFSIDSINMCYIELYTHIC